MIAPLRARHRLMIGLLVVVVPPAVVAALAARPDFPAAPLPPELGAGLAPQWRPVPDPEDGPLVVRLVDREGAPQVELWPREALPHPSVLVYWTSTAETATPLETLPADARLLGTLAGATPRRFALPEQALGAGGRGRLVLYSLGHQSVVLQLALPPAGRP